MAASSISPARTAAFDVLLRVERDSGFAMELLHSSQYSKLSSPDHGLATELVMGVLRWQSWLDQQIAQHSSQSLAKLDAEVLISLRLAVYQLAFLERVPARAAVHESVELTRRVRKRSAVPFVNAVLRKLTDIRRPTLSPPAASPAELAQQFAHPLWLVERWERHFGPAVCTQICAADQQIPGTTVRLSTPDAEVHLKSEHIELIPGILLTSARRVHSGDITKAVAFREGRVVIQDEASQLVALLVGNGAKILDCCAAPGGKTRIIANRNPNAAILAVELHSHRARLLRELVQEKNVDVITADIRDVAPGNFDCVLADVPCSGTGTLARNPEIKWRLKTEDLSDLHKRQAVILQAAMRQVIPGGRLIYSTCSLEPEENAEVITESLCAIHGYHLLDCKAELEKLRDAGELAGSDLNSLTDGPYLRTIPGVYSCDGFFAAIVQRSY